MGLKETEKSPGTSTAVYSHIPSIDDSDRVVVSNGFTFMVEPVRVHTPGQPKSY